MRINVEHVRISITKPIYLISGLVLLIIVYGFLGFQSTKHAYKQKRHTRKFSNDMLTKFDYRNHWEPIEGRKDDVYIYSAYYDQVSDRNPTVRIVALQKSNTQLKQLKCELKYKKEGEVIFTMFTSGRVQPFYQYKTTIFIPKLIICDATNNGIPSSVTIHTQYSVQNEVEVRYSDPNTPTSGQINVCVRALHNHYSNHKLLVEFIEMYKILGATHFTFFNRSVSGEVSEVLELYQSAGEATVLPFDMPHHVEAYSEAQGATNHDCVYRSRGLFQYLIMVDVDEFIFPRLHADIPQMMSYLDNKHFGNFNFASLYYCTNFEDNQTILQQLERESRSHYKLDDPLYLVSQAKTLRANEPCPITTKSKVIMKPWAVHTPDVHEVIRLVKGYKKLYVKSKVAVIHHYRKCPEDPHKLKSWKDNCPDFPHPEVDTFPHRYYKELSRRVANTYQSLARRRA